MAANLHFESKESKEKLEVNKIVEAFSHPPLSKNVRAKTIAFLACFFSIKARKVQLPLKNGIAEAVVKHLRSAPPQDLEECHRLLRLYIFTPKEEVEAGALKESFQGDKGAALLTIFQELGLHSLASELITPHIRKENLTFSEAHLPPGSAEQKVNMDMPNNMSLAQVADVMSSCECILSNRFPKIAASFRQYGGGLGSPADNPMGDQKQNDENRRLREANALIRHAVYDLNHVSKFLDRDPYPEKMDVKDKEGKIAKEETHLVKKDPHGNLVFKASYNSFIFFDYNTFSFKLIYDMDQILKNESQLIISDMQVQAALYACFWAINAAKVAGLPMKGLKSELGQDENAILKYLKSLKPNKLMDVHNILAKFLSSKRNERGEFSIETLKFFENNGIHPETLNWLTRKGIGALSPEFLPATAPLPNKLAFSKVRPMKPKPGAAPQQQPEQLAPAPKKPATNPKKQEAPAAPLLPAFKAKLKNKPAVPGAPNPANGLGEAEPPVPDRRAGVIRTRWGNAKFVD